MNTPPRIAFVYDWFDTQYGGAERVLTELHNQYPHAPWYTSYIAAERCKWAEGWEVRPSFMQRLPRVIRENRILSLLFLPFAFESMDFSSYDLVVSISSGFAKNIITRATTTHVCYLLTPPRWLYAPAPHFRNPLLHMIERAIRRYLQVWDVSASARVDRFVAISEEVAKRCNKIYGVQASVVYPPFEYAHWEQLGIAMLTKPVETVFTNPSLRAALSHRFFMTVARLEPYKQVDLTIQAFHRYLVQKKQAFDKTEKPVLVIVGSGSMQKKLKRLAAQRGVVPAIFWLSQLTDAQLAWLYTHTSAFIALQQEDFGYVFCEAMACNSPIIAYKHGGQAEILHGYTRALLLNSQEVSEAARALEKSGDIGYNAQTYENSHLRGWSRNSFMATFQKELSQAV